MVVAHRNLTHLASGFRPAKDFNNPPDVELFNEFNTNWNRLVLREEIDSDRKRTVERFQWVSRLVLGVVAYVLSGHPKIAISCDAMAPLFAAIVAPALRRPCAVLCLRSAWLHHWRNLLPNPASENDRPSTSIRNVISPQGDASMISFSGGKTGNANHLRVLRGVNTSLPAVMCCRPNRIASPCRWPVNSINAKAKRPRFR